MCRCPQKPEGGARVTGVSCPMWVAGSQTQGLSKAVSAHNIQATSPAPFLFFHFYLLRVCSFVCLVFVVQRIKPGASYMLRSVTLSKPKIHHFEVHNSGIFQYIYRAVL